MIEGRHQIDQLLEALNASLSAMDAPALELLICGGAALAVMELISRPTLDIDVLAIVDGEQDVMAKPFPAYLRKAVSRVARAHSLSEDWLNHGPADMQRFGLPVGILDRALKVEYGDRLAVRFVGRYDQIHFKLYALVDQGTGKHLDDFIQLRPTEEEVDSAAMWCINQDPSGGFKLMLTGALTHLGFENVAARIQ